MGNIGKNNLKIKEKEMMHEAMREALITKKVMTKDGQMLKNIFQKLKKF